MTAAKKQTQPTPMPSELPEPPSNTQAIARADQTSVPLRLVSDLNTEIESMGRLLVHDLANHINVLTLSIMKLQGQSDLETRMIQRAQQALQAMTATVSASRDILALEEGRLAFELDSVNINNYLSNALKEFQTSRHYLKSEIELTLCRDDLEVMIDPNHFGEKVLHPLFSNAVRFSEESDLIKIGVVEEKGSLTLIIENQSTKIPADWANIFFTGSKKIIRPGRDLKKGLGLSMRLVKACSEALGLTISVHVINPSPANSQLSSVQIRIQNFVVTR